MALGSGRGGGGLNEVIRRASRRGAPTATGAGTPGTATPTTSYPSSTGYAAPSTVPASQAVSRPRLPAIPTQLLAQLNPSLAGLAAAKTKPRVARKEERRDLQELLKSIDDPAARQLAPYAIQASRSVKGAVPASVLLALSGQESDFGRNQGPSSAGAQGVTQFIPSTRQSFIDQYNVDPWKNAKSGFKASALYLRDLGFKNDPQGALSSYSGGYAAGDYNNPILQSAQQFKALDRAGGKGRLPKGPKPLSTSELFYDPGVNLADGQPTSPIGGHSTHVHFGSERPRDILRAARVAQNFGADVRENPAFDPVDPVHTEGSMHYQEQRIPRRLANSRLAQQVGATGGTIGEAIDISGGDLGKINQRLAKLSGSPVSRSSSTMSYGGTGSTGVSGGQLASYGPSLADSGMATTSSRQRATSLSDLMGSLRPPIRSEGLTPRADLSPRTRRRGDEEEDEERTLYELLHGSGGY